MIDYQIGKAVGVFGDEIFIALADHDPTADSEHGVPDSMTLHLQTDEGPTKNLHYGLVACRKASLHGDRNRDARGYGKRI